MKVSISLIVATLAARVFADLHYTGICVDNPARGVTVYNRRATEKACAAYRNRNTGNAQWDRCPDCTLKSDRDILFYCQTAAQHMGGDELEYYCKQNGASSSVAW
ncbi:hypothetical protein KXV68_005175 [Aspergillus fumigatus]|nr:hypothetical protein CNMCM8714_007784 [Aspergillus fumigatus]KMK58613.1 hypothetical protein Y699_07840 [Aspergillus fumigatus Z5]KAF4267542.1 hypothetical protein CNMCM8812_002164 [Aspergillus fumigatus]KAH1294255.1 hypothetical protein KXX11_008884 [Aspergillus fumigatus]KAH1334861.1 hypothetical protein KXX67_005421 [Aspergillus fumigatus]